MSDERPLLSTPEEAGLNPLKALAFIAGFAAMFFGLRLLGPEVRVQIYIGGAVGLLCGAVPFLLARKKGHAKLAGGALLTCAIAGAAGGALLTVPLALVLLIVAFRRPAVPALE